MNEHARSLCRQAVGSDEIEENECNRCSAEGVSELSLAS